MGAEASTSLPSPTDRDSREAGVKSSNYSSQRSQRISVKLNGSANLRQTVRDQLVLERQLEDAAKMMERARLSRCTLACRTIVESKCFVGLTTILTCYALVGDDSRLISTDQPADLIFNVCTIICMVIFFFEVVLSCQGKEDYFLGFFFFLDSISTVTLVLDLTWVNEALLQGDEEDMDNFQGGKSARIGARAARIVRVLRLVRILKLYKALYEARAAQLRAEKKRKKQKSADQGEWHADDEDFDDSEIYISESQVGKKLSELTTRRVIILVLAMMLGLPFFSIDKAMQLPSATTYGADLVMQAFQRMENNSNYRESYELALLQYVYFHNWFSRECPQDRLCPADYYSNIFWFGLAGRQDDEVIQKSEQAYVRASTVAYWTQSVSRQDALYMLGSMPAEVDPILSSLWKKTCRTKKGMLRRGVSLLEQKIPGFIDYIVDCPEDLRAVERTKHSGRLRKKDDYKDWHFAFYVDNRGFVKEEASMNLVTTGFICIVLMAASILISSDSQALVLRPVESMMLKVHMIRINPLMATKLADDAFKQEEILKAKAAKAKKSRWQQIRQVVLCTPVKDGQEQPMETIILEKTIIKLGTLLALGFGEAGANIIGHNMSSGDSAVVNAMIPGVQVECIIGSARIRDFSVATETLQKKVMTFVNQVSEIVHGVVDAYHGVPNRNNGDMFLVIWPISEFPDDLAQKMADMAMLALVKIFSGVHRSGVLAAYRGHPGLQQRLGEGVRVNVTFGLHYGWAIEGAVGSEFKIDASYLSPNVTVAETVEHATEVYGVAILITSAVLDLCSEEMAGKCRLIDCIMAQGYLTPLELFAIDLNSFFLEIEQPHDFRWGTRQRFRSRQFLETEKKNKLQPECVVVDLFDNDLDIITMRAPYTLEFMQIFNMGYQNYSQGEWEVAGRILWNTRTMLGFEDGPSSALLRYMHDTSDYKCPEGWQGLHQLEETGRMGPPVNASGGKTAPAARQSTEKFADKLTEAYVFETPAKEGTESMDSTLFGSEIPSKWGRLQLDDDEAPQRFSSDCTIVEGSREPTATEDVMKQNPVPPEPVPLVSKDFELGDDDVAFEEPPLLNRMALQLNSA